MEEHQVSEPIEFIPIGPRLYPVGKITAETIKRLWPLTKILSESAGKPIEGDIAMGYIATTRALIDGEHPELTDDHITSWLSQALCNMVAQEYLRQFLVVKNFARA